MKNFLILLCAIVALSGCQNHHPKMISFTPASVVIDYSKNDLHEATSMAQQFCSSIHKDAQYVKHKESGLISSLISSEKTAFFNCVESSSSRPRFHDSNQSQGSVPIINNYK